MTHTGGTNGKEGEAGIYIEFVITLERLELGYFDQSWQSSVDE